MATPFCVFCQTRVFLVDAHWDTWEHYEPLKNADHVARPFERPAEEEPRPDPFADALREQEKIRAIQEAAWNEGMEAGQHAIIARTVTPNNPYERAR